MIPDDRLMRDLRDVFVWLEHRHRAQGEISLHVMRAPSQPVGEFAIAHIYTDRKDLDFERLHDDMLTALATLGYSIAWPEDGADPEDVEVPAWSELPSHERLTSADRIEQVMGVVSPLRRPG